MRTIARIAALSCLITSLVALEAHAQDVTPPPEYQPLIDGAVAEFASERWAEARSLFQSAHDLYPNARTLRGIGMASYEMRDYPSAVRALAASIDDTRRPLTTEQRAHVSALLARARAFVGRFVVPPAPSGARLYLDGTGAAPEGDWPATEGALLVGVGAHEVTIRSADGRTAHARIVVRGQEDGPLDIDLAPIVTAPEPAPAAIADAPRPVPHDPPTLPAPTSAASARADSGGAGPLPWVVAGTGGAMLIAGGAMLGVGLSDRATVEGAPMGTEWAELQDAHARSGPLVAAGAVLIGVGVAAGIAGIVWAALSAERATPDESALRIDVGLGTLTIGGTF